MSADDFNYNSFLELLEIIENNILCPFCKDRHIISISPFDLLFMCPECGKHFDIDLVELIGGENEDSKK